MSENTYEFPDWIVENFEDACEFYDYYVLEEIEDEHGVDIESIRGQLEESNAVEDAAVFDAVSSLALRLEQAYFEAQ